MIPRRWPFQWGPGVPSVTPVPPTPVVPPLWGRVTATGNWRRGAVATMTPRFEHVYAQVPGVMPFLNQDVVHRVQSDYPFRIATGNAVVIASHLSEP